MSDTDVIDIRAAVIDEKTPAPREAQPEEKRTLRLCDITEVASRLGRLLAEESHFLDIMDFKSVAKLQNEKLKLISALEIQKKIIKMDPSIKQNFPQEEMLEFENVSAMFDKILAENYRQLMRMKTVNQKVVDIVAKAVAKRTVAPTAYGKNGVVVPQSLSDVPLALSQNI